MKLIHRTIIIITLFLWTGKSIYAQTILPYTDSKILYEGRVDLTETDGLGLYWPGTSVKARFIGTEIQAEMEDFSPSNSNYYYVLIDGSVIQKIEVNGAKKYYPLASGLSNQEHTVELVKLNNIHEGYHRLHSKFHNFKIIGAGSFLPLVQTKTRKIEFYGNSITVGLSNEYYNPAKPAEDNSGGQYENNYIGFAASTARYFNAQYSCIAKNGIGLMVSTTNTKMPLMYDKIDPMDDSRTWDFSKYQPDIVVVTLLQNDASIILNPSSYPTYATAFPDGAPTDQEIVDAYKSFIAQLRVKYPNAKIICALGPMGAINPNQNSRWKNYVTVAASQLNDNKIFVHFFEYIGRGGHPKALDNETLTNSLTCFIKCNGLWDAP